MKTIISGNYSFSVDIDIEYDIYTYRFIAMSKHPYPCVQITVYDNMIGNIDMLNYYANCSYSKKLLEKGSGSIYMLKTALTYVADRHPDVKQYDLQDETYMELPGKPLITARRLLMGEKGWYEEYLDAIPTQKTKYIIQYLRDSKNRMLYQNKIPDVEKTWWTPKNTMQICYSIKCPGSVLGTTWYIPKDIIDSYGINYIIQDSINGGYKKQRYIFEKAIKRKPCYSIILEAKYRY